MKEKIFQQNEKNAHLSQLIIFEKSYLFKRNSNCHNINIAAEVIVHFLA